MARAKLRSLTPHLVAWAIIALIVWAQAPGQIAADTKFDLTTNPAGFLAQAMHAYTDRFTLGQLQNQAYGYLFPQGAFFLLPLPAWVLQRCWWTLLVGLAFSGTYALARRMGMRGVAGPAVAGALYAFSPRILTTLTAISSEAWPVALVPWTLLPLLGAERRPRLAAALLPVACMGAVNATATIAACLPALLVLCAQRQWRAAALWPVGAVLVSAWWLGPLVVLGRYSPPFTDFIESASVTTAWLNPIEVLRGTTSWTPFVDAKRAAGHLLVTEPVFVLLTAGVAALGIAGLARRDMPARAPLITVFAVGVGILCFAHAHPSLFDVPLAAFRNLHKFDPLVRLPLVLGAGWVVSRARAPQLVGAVTLVAVAVSPAWSLRLLPQGTWQEPSADWVAAARWLDEHATGTRTLVVPAAPFARQTWGWTRDEPIQGLSQARFAVRDAIPLVDPEAIRGLDGQVCAVDSEALRAIGVGVVVVRHDLEEEVASTSVPDLGEPTVRFGDVDIYALEPTRDMMLTSANPVRVDAGGEALPLLWREFGYFPATLTSGDADIVTDTPALAVRNYGAVQRAQSAHLASAAEGKDVRNLVPDYPSAGTPVGVAMEGNASASSSAADATAFGGARASRSLTAAFDGLDDTAWWPAAQDPHPWLRFTPNADTATITATANTKVQVTDASGERTLSLVADQPRTISVRGETTLTLTEPVGITEIDAGIHRIVDVPGTADTYFFQRLMPETTTLQRAFTTAEDAEWELSSPALIDGSSAINTVFLPAGRHELVTDAETITLRRGSAPAALSAAWEPVAGDAIARADQDRLLITTRAYNPGLQASLDGEPLTPQRIDAGQLAFHIPAGRGGTLDFSFAGERPYRLSLFGGAALSLVTVLVLLWFAWRRRGVGAPARPVPGRMVAALPLAAALCINPVLGIVSAIGVWTVRRYTLLASRYTSAGAITAMGLWLARAPWPSAGYAGDATLMLVAGCVAVACLAWPD